MADNTIVTEIVLDARGIEAGTATYIRAMNAAQAAADRTIDASRRVQESQDKQVATMVGVEASIRKIEQQWNRLRSSVDPATSANIAYQKSLEQITLVSDRAVSRLGVLKETADKVAASARLAAQQALQAAGAPTGAPNDPNAILGITASTASARASAAAFEEQLTRLEEIARLKAQQIAETFGSDLNRRLIAGTAKSARESASVFEAELARMDEIASLKAQQIGSAFAADLNSRLVAGTAKSARESAAVFEAELSRIDEIAKLKAQQAGANFQAGLNQALGVGVAAKSARESASAFEEVFAEQERVAKSAEALRAQINPLGTAFAGLGKQLAENAALQRAGAISTKELARANALAVDRFNNIERSMKSATTAGRSLSGEVTQLGFQINDVLTGIALGQSPFMILAQQGGQIIQIVAAAKNSILDMLVGVAKGAWAFLTPIRLAIGGLITIGLTAVTAAASWQSAQRDITVALAGIGRATGASRGDINRIAGAGASVFGFSVSEAREFASTLAATGKIGFDALTPLVRLGHDFAKTFGVDSVEAAKTLATALSDPVRGSAQLNERLGFMDAAMQRNIKNLVEQNRLFEAQQIIVQAIQSNVLKASEVTGFWSTTWTAIGNAISNAYDKLGQILSRATGIGLTTEEQLQRAKDRVAELEELSSRRSSAVNKGLGTTAEITRLNQEIDRLTEKLGEAARQAAAVKLNLESLRIGKTVMGFLPEIDNLQNLINQQITVGGAARGDSEILRKLGITQEQAERAKSIIDGLVAHFKTSFEQIRAQSGIAFDAITAFSPAQKAMIALRQEEERLRTASDLSPEEKKTAAQLKYNEALHAANTQLSEAARERRLAAEQSVQSTQLEIDLVGKNIGEQTRLRADLQARHQLEQEAARNRTAFDNDEFARLQKINEELGKRTQQLARTQVRDQTRFDTQTAFLSQEDVQIAQQLRGLYPDVATALNSVEANGIRVANALRGMKDGAVDFVKTFASGILDGKDAVESLLTALDNLAKKLLNTGIETLFSGIASTNPVQAALGAVEIAGAFLIDWFSDTTKAQREAEKQLEEAKKKWSDMQDQFLDFIGVLNGTVMGSLTKQLRDVTKTAFEMGRAAYEAKDWQALFRIIHDFNQFVQRTAEDFARSFPVMIEALNAGQGFESPLLAGVQKTKQITDQLKGFLDDTQNMFSILGGWHLEGMIPVGTGDASSQVALAQRAAQTYALSLLDTIEPLSDTAKQILEMRGVAMQLQVTLQDLGMSAEDAAEAINTKMAQAMVNLRTKLTDDLQRQINEAAGQSYINQIDDLLKDVNQKIADFTLAGADTSLIPRYLQLETQRIIDQANLTGEAFSGVLALFPELTNVVQESSKALAEQIAEQKKFQQTILDFLEQLRGGDLSTLSPQQKFLVEQQSYQQTLASAQMGDSSARAKLTQTSQGYLEQARSYLGPSLEYGAIYNRVVADLKALAGLRDGGIVGSYNLGGLIGNGIWNVDSVRASYAGGGNVMLAGGEFVARAPSVTPATFPVLQYINRTGSPPSNDDRELAAEVKSLRRDLVAALGALAQSQERGNDLATEGVRETRNLRIDIRQNVGEAKIRQNS